MPIFRLPDFSLGIIAGLIYARGWRSIPNRGMLFGVSLALALFAGVFSPLLPLCFRAPLAAPLFALLVYSLACSRGPFARLLAWRPIYKLGDASYSIYILQSPLMAYFLYVTQGSAAAQNGSRTLLGWGGFVLYCAILICLSLACYTYIESPARKWISSVLNNRIRNVEPASLDAVPIRDGVPVG
jgi:peptidoglycan/LPS O-acetylase OafA/YrhL